MQKNIDRVGYASLSLVFAQRAQRIGKCEDWETAPIAAICAFDVTALRSVAIHQSSSCISNINHPKGVAK